MPSLKAIRTRITSVKNTRKITRAIKLVSTAKLRRAQDALIAARPYSSAIAKVVSELSAVAGAESHKLFEDRPLAKAAIVVVTSDRGQAGAYNANVVKAVERYAANELSGATEVSLRIIGRKGNQYFSRRRTTITSFDAAPTGATALEVAREMANRIIADFETKKVDRVFVVYNEFKSAISQGVVAQQVLPVVPEAVQAIVPAAGAQGEAVATDYAYEPDKATLLSSLVPLYVEIGIYRAALESIASEHGARMTSMDNATRNAGDMIDRLTLVYNRARQASITKELLEIIGGAEALKG
jgi:F-type H+-transporting ATPase subunit gamma